MKKTIEENKLTKSIKKTYQAPKIKSLGDIRDMTMGGSPGIGDSGAVTPEKPL